MISKPKKLILAGIAALAFGLCGINLSAKTGNQANVAEDACMEPLRVGAPLTAIAEMQQEQCIDHENGNEALAAAGLLSSIFVTATGGFMLGTGLAKASKTTSPQPSKG